MERNYHNSEIPEQPPRGFTDAPFAAGNALPEGGREGMERNYHNSEIPEQPPRGFTDASFCSRKCSARRGQRRESSGTINRR